MRMQRCSEDVVLVELPGEPETGKEIEGVVRHIRDRGACDVVADFSDVTIITSTSLASLLRLEKLLDTQRRRLMLCCVDQATRGIFSVTGLDGILEFVDTRSEALSALKVQVSPTE